MWSWPSLLRGRLVPRKPGERVKTDRRDALTLPRLLRAGELTPVWVPGPEQEAIRDLTRAREDMKAAELKARQRLSAFLLRHDRVYREGKSAWTQRHARWLQAQAFAHPAQQIVFQESVDAVTAAGARVAGLDEQIRAAVDDWSLAPVVHALMALRGVHLLTAVTVLAELGDLTRFDHPRQLMGFLGLVPGEHSSGTRRRQGAITKTGHARRVLVEAAWSYRFPARQTAHLQRKGAHARPRPRPSPGRRRNACADAIGPSAGPGSPHARSPPPSPANWPATCGPSPALSTSNPARSRDATNAAPARSRVREPERRAPVRRTLEGTMWR